jgi:Skp family chaperone for outer membrane proteins
MLRPTRATLVVGLTLVGVFGLVGRSFGQQQGDPRVQPVASPPASNPTPVARPTAAPATPSAAMPLSIGSIDVDRVLKDYDKFKVANETIRAESLERYQQLMKLANEGKQEQEKHQRFAQGSPDQKKSEDRITQLKAQIEALRENSEREFTQKEAETMATIYNEIAAMSRSVAKKRGMAFVVKYSDSPANGNEPNSVVAAMSRTILYSDPSVDITNEVTLYLNHFYKQSGGPAPKGNPMSMPGQPGQANPPARQPQMAPPARPATPGVGN